MPVYGAVELSAARLEQVRAGTCTVELRQGNVDQSSAGDGKAKPGHAVRRAVGLDSVGVDA